MAASMMLLENTSPVDGRKFNTIPMADADVEVKLFQWWHLSPIQEPADGFGKIKEASVDTFIAYGIIFCVVNKVNNLDGFIPTTG